MPVEDIPFSGAVAPSRMSLLSIVLLLFPVTAVVVLRLTTPVEAVFTPRICKNSNVVPDAPLIKRTAGPPVLVLEIVISRVAPVPPGRPSIVTKLDPLRSINAVALEPVIESPVAPVAGLIVIVADALPMVGGIAGNVSTELR